MRRSALAYTLSLLTVMALLPVTATTAAPRTPRPRYSVSRDQYGAPLARLAGGASATASAPAAALPPPVPTQPLAAGHILLVDDDRDGEEYGGGLDVSNYFTDGLSGLGQSYTVWNTLAQGTPTLALMQDAAAVIWFTGLDFRSSINDLPVLSASELQVMRSYLQAGGRLLLTGEDALSSSDNGPDGLGGLLHVTYLQDSIFDPQMAGTPAPRPSMAGDAADPLAAGRTFDVSWAEKSDGAWPDGWGGEFATDEAAPADSTASPVLTTRGIGGAFPVGGGVVGIKAFSDATLDSPPAYAARTVWLGFGLENVNNDTGFNSRSELLGSILAWLRDEIPATLLAAAAPAGQASTFTLSALPTQALPRSYRWDFGDGTPRASTGHTSIKHTYERGGVFTVRVEARDSLQHSTVASTTVTITAADVEREVTLSPSADTYLDRWRPTLSNGGDGRLAVRAADVLAPLLTFDVAGIPPGATISSAGLRLYADTRTNVGTTEIGVFRMLGDWSASAATWQQAASGRLWGAPGANGSGTDRVAAPASSLRLNAVGRWYTFDVRSIVQSWADGQPNKGFALKYVGGDTMVAYTFASSEYPDPGWRPQLTIHYVNP